MHLQRLCINVVCQVSASPEYRSHYIDRGRGVATSIYFVSYNWDASDLQVGKLKTVCFIPGRYALGLTPGLHAGI